MLKTLPITEALEITNGIPELEQALNDLYDTGAEFVELGIVDDEIVVKEAVAVTGPTVDSVHVDGSGKKKRKPLVLINSDFQPVAKAETETVSEERYTFSPWYVPDSVDAHGEWTDKAEVQRAFWKYLALDDRDIRLQHNLDIVAGKWVEGATWPYEVSLPVKHPEGDVEYTFPAGTPFLGIVWEPWAWELIKSGDIRGLSIGGTAKRLEAELQVEASYEPTGRVGFND